jgi:hypothetical protein
MNCLRISTLFIYSFIPVDKREVSESAVRCNIIHVFYDLLSWCHIMIALCTKRLANEAALDIGMHRFTICKFSGKVTHLITNFVRFGAIPALCVC